MRHIDTTDPVYAEEVNVNGTMYHKTVIPQGFLDSVYRKYVGIKYRKLLDKYPDLEITLLEGNAKSEGPEPEVDFFQDFCIEPKEDVELDMTPIIIWWLDMRDTSGSTAFDHDEEPNSCPRCDGKVTPLDTTNDPGVEYKKFRCGDCGFKYTETWRFESWKVECEDCEDLDCRNTPEKECDQTSQSLYLPGSNQDREDRGLDLRFEKEI